MEAQGEQDACQGNEACGPPCVAQDVHDSNHRHN